MADLQRSHAARKSPNLRLASERPHERRSAGARLSLASAALPADLVEIRIQIESEGGLVEARRQSRLLAARCGFPAADRALIAAMVSELARNILLFAAAGVLSVRLVEDGRRRGIRITAEDRGPGIGDLRRVLQEGFSTAGRPGLGLSGVKWLSDEFEIMSGPGRGTTVLVGKWRS